MLFHPWRRPVPAALPRRRSRGIQQQCPCPRPAGRRPSLELLEDRTVPSGSPIPIPGGVLTPNPFGGPDVHFHFPGPVDSGTPNAVGGDPSWIYNFNGFVGVAHVEGTGTDNHGNTLFWDTDLRFL
jgi:hypothetical protein